ncbi:MAG: hypothetical protein Q8P95_02085 [bacterium]|nr:hypothetical protein [bacterium]
MKRHLAPLLFYTATAIAILWQLLLPGYIPLHVSGAHPQVFFEHWYEYLNLYNLLYYLLNLILPNWIVMKLLMVGLVLGTGLSMHHTLPVKRTSLRYLAGFFYVVNPFFHTRLMIGHLHVVAGYALFPLAIYFLRKLKLKNVKSWKNLLLISFLLANISIHLGYIFAAFTGLFALTHLLKKKFKKACVIVGIVALGSLLNVQIFFGKTLSAVESFNEQHFGGYATAVDPDYGALGNVLGLYGYALEPYLQHNGYLLTKSLLPFWPVLSGLFFVVALMGWFRNRKKAPLFFLCSLLFLIFSIIIATGTSSAWTSKIFIFFRDNLPFFSGFREPQKWVAFISFFLAFFGSLGLGSLLPTPRKRSEKDFLEEKSSGGSGVIFEARTRNEQWKLNRTDMRLVPQRENNIIVPATREKLIKIRTATGLILAFSIIILSNITLFGGFFGRMQPFWYPADWHTAKELIFKKSHCLNQTNCELQKLLFLPWNIYITPDFTKKTFIASPGKRFFAPIPVVQSKYMEGYNRPEDPVSDTVQRFLINPGPGQLAELAKLDIRWIVYSKHHELTDVYDYRFLEQSEFLDLIFEGKTLQLYHFDKK